MSAVSELPKATAEQVAEGNRAWPSGQPPESWRAVALYDLSPQDALALVAPDMVWLSMLPFTPLRHGRSPGCYTTAGGTPVHVRPECRCRR